MTFKAGSQQVASRKQIKANRRNALKSTGPRTKAGKAKSSQNAVKHGLAVAKFDVNAILKIRKLAEALSKEQISVSPTTAKLFATAEVQIRQIRIHRSALFQNASASIDEVDIGKLIRNVRLIDRYERRAIFRRKKAFDLLANEIVDMSA